MKLADLQQAFWQSATRRGSADPALFVSSATLAASRRLEIYADMFIWRQIECLREDFPKLASVLHDETFYALSEAYLRAHPSRHHSLSKLGAQLPVFLASHPVAREDLADLARLEWARAEVFDERDVAVATPDPQRLEGSRVLTLIPALRVLPLDYDVATLWAERERELPASPPRRTPTTIVVWRKDFEVYHAPIDADEAAALARAAAGATLPVICEAFEDAPEPIASAMRALGSWFAEGWISDHSDTHGSPI